jgi:ABC-type glutathione transport system ATPase component
LADYLLVMEAGKIRDQGATADVIARAKQRATDRQQAAEKLASSTESVHV